MIDEKDVELRSLRRELGDCEEIARDQADLLQLYVKRIYSHKSTIASQSVTINDQNFIIENLEKALAQLDKESKARYLPTGVSKGDVLDEIIALLDAVDKTKTAGYHD